DIEAKHDSLVTAPNVMAVLPGTDSTLRREYVLLVAHMDHVGSRGDSGRIANGADDNASGTARLLALARAFSQPGTRPRRPLLLLATSGGAEGKEIWGSNYFINSAGPDAVAAISLHMIGRPTGDSVLVDGLNEVGPVRPSWTAALHPELGLFVVNG